MKNKKTHLALIFIIACAVLIWYGISTNQNIFIGIGAIADVVTIIKIIKQRIPKNEEVPNFHIDFSKMGFSKDWVSEKYYSEFIGRSEYLKSIESFFLDQDNHKQTLLIHSSGGFGKTALCRQALENLYQTNIYIGFIWLQNKTDSYDIIKDSVQREKIKYLSYELLINDICNKVELMDASILSLAEKENKLFKIFEHNRLLIIIDGVENKEQFEPIFNKLLKLFTSKAKTKLLITSRVKLDNSTISQVLLNPFSPQESIEYLKSFASEKSELSYFFQTLFPKKIDRILQITSGNPILMKVFLSHLCYLDFEFVFQKFENSEYAGLNDYLFSSSFEYLKKSNPFAIQIMKLLANFSQGMSCSRIYEQYMNNHKEVENGLKVLSDLALVESSHTDSVRRYKLHSHIRKFLLENFNNG